MKFVAFFLMMQIVVKYIVICSTLLLFFYIVLTICFLIGFKSLKLILEISTTYKLVSYMLADN